MKNSVKAITRTFFATAAISAFVVSPLMAADDLDSGRPLSRQIVVQKADSKDEVKELVAKLKNSQDKLAGDTQIAEATQPKTEEAPVINNAEEEAPVLNNAKEEAPVIEKDQDDDAAFAPKTNVKQTKVKMPTVFTTEQKALYDNLTGEEQIALVRRLATKYGLDRLYPDYNTRTYTNDSYSSNYKNYTDSYTYNNNYSDNYSTAYSTSNYNAGGCKH